MSGILRPFAKILAVIAMIAASVSQPAYSKDGSDDGALLFTSAFYRAVNLNGSATTIDGNSWVASTGASNFTMSQTGGGTFANQSVTLVPSTDANRATMIRSSIYGNVSLAMSSVPAGYYNIYVYIWEDNSSTTYSMSIEGTAVVTNGTTGSAGAWTKLGPYRTNITDGTINITTTGGANISGLEVWTANNPPVVSNALPDHTAIIDEAFNYTVPANAFTDPDAGTTFTYTATLDNGSALPAWLSFNTSTRKFTGTPASGNAGTINIRVTASDGELTTNDVFSLTVGASFYRALNLNGAALTIDGNSWEASASAANFNWSQTGGGAFSNQSITLNPSTDANRTTMIRSSFYGAPTNVNLTSVPTGTYDISLYVWEDNSTVTYSVSIEGTTVASNLASGTAGSWAKLGPFRRAITDGAINIVTTNGVNVSGVDVRRANTGEIPLTVTLNPSTQTLAVGEAWKLDKTVSPNTGSNQNVTWSSNNTSIATVDNTGLVRAVAVGTATITATSTEGAYSGTSNVTVLAAGSNTLLNPEFDLGMNNWSIGDWAGTPANASSVVQGAGLSGTNALYIDINNANSDGWTYQFKTPLPFRLEQGRTYKVSFKAKAQSTRTLDVALFGETTGTNHYFSNVSLTTAVQTYNLTYVCNTSAVNSDLLFTLAFYTAKGVISDLWIDKVYVSDVTGLALVTGVTVSPTSVSINTGATTQLNKTITPSNATNQNVVWVSSNPSVATVNNAGLVTGVAAGTATITVTTVDGEYAMPSTVTVTDIIPTAVDLSPTSLALNPGQTSQLTKTITPSNSTNLNVLWSTSNPSVATVDNTGLVTAVASGSATITVTTVSGSRTKTASVTVSNVAVTGVSLLPSSLTLAPLETSQLDKTVTPSNATNKNVTWLSSDPAIATVSNSGLVTAVAVGSATITVTTVDGGFTFPCSVVVRIPVTNVSLQASLSLNEGTTASLTPVITPPDATNKTVTWTSSDTNVATVNLNGIVTALAVGNATITATSVDGVHSASSSVSVLNSQPVDLSGVLNLFAFQYKYDSRDRIIEKKVPGAGWVYMVYDKRDRLVMTQDANQRERNPREWTFTKYDELNRPVLTGKFADASNRELTTMQTDVDQFYVAATSNSDEWFESRVSAGTGVHGYTNNSFPKVASESSYFTVTYYDDYDFIPTSLTGFNYDNNQLTASGTEIAQESQNFARVFGQATGGKIKNLDTDEWMYSVNYFDDNYRVIQSISQNNKGGVDKVTSIYDFVGKVLRTKTDHTISGQSSITTARRLSYDHAGRLLQTEHSYNGDSYVILAKNEYNELGQLITKSLDSDEQQPDFKQKIDYRYNIRGWLTRINDSNLSNAEGGPKDYFGMNLGYNDNMGLGSGSEFNGNISAMKYSTAMKLSERGYKFSYDALNRLHNADYMQLTTQWNTSSSFNENSIEYDLNGNIQNLNRDGDNEPIDEMMYHYDGNRLMGVDDAGDPLKGFVNGNTAGHDYAYDVNGNMTIDRNKGITNITYNHLNLPSVVTKGGDYIKYIYNAAGAKLAQEVYVGGTLQKRPDYLGEFNYEDNVLKFINHEEGRVVLKDGEPQYQYTLKDHLGNNRITFAADADVAVAALETAKENAERAEFLKYDDVRKVNTTLFDHTDVGTTHYSLRLSGTTAETFGLAKSIAVQPGDKIKAKVYAKYVDMSQTSG